MKTQNPSVKRQFKTFILLLLPWCVSDHSAIAADGSKARHSVPTEVTTLAQSILRDQWKSAIGANPAFYQLEGVDVSNVNLTEPFTMLELRGVAVDSFAASLNDDPRDFPALEKFCFPISLPDGSDAGTIIMMRNRDETRNKILPDRGEFVTYGYLARGAAVLSDVSALRKAYPGQTNVYLVSYEDSGTPARYMVETNDGSLVAGANAKLMRPLAEDARVVRQDIIKFQKGLEHSKDHR